MSQTASLFEFGSVLVRHQAKIVQQQEPKVVDRLALDASYQPKLARVWCLWWDRSVDTAILLGICGTKARADTEAEALGHDLRAVVRIEAREVHS